MHPRKDCQPVTDNLPVPTDLSPPPPQGEFWTIKGGHNIGGSSKIAQKNYMREAQHQQVFLTEQYSKQPCTEGVPITFIEADVKGVIQPHKDALVILVMIYNFAV